MQGDLSFGNFDQVDHRDNFEPIPANTYDFRILTPELKPTKAGDGQKVEIPLQVEGGEFNGRKVFARFNVANQSAATVEIALKQLKQLFMSAGVPATGDIKMSMIAGLESRMCRAQVYIKKDQDHGDKNEIRRFVVPTDSQPGQVIHNQNQNAAYQPQNNSHNPQVNNNVNQVNGGMPWQQGN